MTSCEIKFDSPEGIYYAGQNLSIQVEVKLAKPKQLRSIFILIKGHAKCTWIKKYRAHRKTRSVAYEGEEIYLETVTYLQGNETSEPIVLPPGTHTFNTICVLPNHLPTSFEGSIGHIRYSAKVTIDRPWKFDHTFKRAFTVLRQYDLNYESSLRLPVELQRDHTMCCFPCRSGPFKWAVKIPVGGYAAGQKLPIQIDIVNHSGSAIRYFKFLLRRIVLYHATNPKLKTRREKEQVIDYKFQERAIDYGETHLQCFLDIPSAAPTNITNSKTVQVTYELKISAVTTGCHDDIVMKLPIVIGTVPLYPLPLNNAAQLSPGEAALQPTLNPSYTHPVYEEPQNFVPKIIKEADDDNYTVCNLFTVKYPVFKNEAAYSDKIHSMYPPSTSSNDQYQAYSQVSPVHPHLPYPTSSGSSSSAGAPYPTSPTSDSRQHLLPSPTAPVIPRLSKE